MRAWNRAKLLGGYLTRRTRLAALPVEYIVETTAKCNLYCPMCPREGLTRMGLVGHLRLVHGVKTDPNAGPGAAPVSLNQTKIDERSETKMVEPGTYCPGCHGSPFRPCRRERP